MLRKDVNLLRIEPTPFIARAPFCVANALGQNGVVRFSSTRALCRFHLCVALCNHLLVLDSYVIVIMLLDVDVAHATSSNQNHFTAATLGASTVTFLSIALRWTKIPSVS